MKSLSVIKVFDFAEYPGPRYRKQGEDSGELFYNKVFKEAFENAVELKEVLTIDLDYTAGYAPSFIDEIFGSLVYDFEFDNIKSYLNIKSQEEPHWVNFVELDVWPKWIKKKNAGEPRKPE